MYVLAYSRNKLRLHGRTERLKTRPKEAVDALVAGEKVQALNITNGDTFELYKGNQSTMQ